MFRILFSPKRAEKHPVTMMFIGIFYSSLSILLSAWIFPSQASLVMVFFTGISCLYVVQAAFRLEENTERDYKTEEWTLKHHVRILNFLLFLFLGFVISFAFWSAIYSPEQASVFFKEQAHVVDGIKSMASTGEIIGGDTFLIILTNNLKVMVISLILAFIFGAGVIFVLVWNASVMGFVIGELARNTLGIIALPVAFAKYFIHGIPEMIAYMVVALAGGILYVAVIRRDFFKPGRTKRILIDTLILITIAIAILIIAAAIEVYISPYI